MKILLAVRKLLMVFLVVTVVFPFRGGKAEDSESGFREALQEEMKWSKAKNGIPDYITLFYAAYKAKGDPIEAFNEAERYAVELGTCRDFSIALNNSLASPDESAFLEKGYEKYTLEQAESHAGRYSNIAKEVLEARAAEEARAITRPSLWTNERFLEKYGTDMTSFVPSAPYGGVCLLTVSKDAFGYPGQRYNGDEKAEEFPPEPREQVDYPFAFKKA